MHGSRTELLPKLLHASLQRLDRSMRHLIQGWSRKHERVAGNYSRMDPGSWLWAGRGERSRMCLRDKTAPMCPGTPAEQVRVLSVSQDNDFCSLTSCKLFLRCLNRRVKQEKLPARLWYQKPAPAPFPAIPLHQQCTEASCVCIQQESSCTLLR